MTTVALIPVFNEAEGIAATLQAVATLSKLDKIVVINDGSRDNTGKIVQRLARENPKLNLLDLKQNLGKGGALNHGLRACRADVYLFLDGDLTSSAGLANKLLEPILQGQADMTIAQFVSAQSADPWGMGFGIARRFASVGVYFLTGKRIASPLSGQRAFKAELLEKVYPIFEGFGVEVGLTVGALYHDFEVLEVPVAMHHRGYGRGIKGFKHRGKQFVHITRALWQCKQRGWHKWWWL